MEPPSLALSRFLPYRLSIASSLVSDVVATAYQALFALKVAEWRLIAVIAEAGAITQQDICQYSRMDKVTVSRAAIALAGRALIARQANPADARSHLLSLTAAGETLYRQVAPKALELEAAIFADFSEEEVALLSKMLDRIEGAALTLSADT